MKQFLAIALLTLATATQAQTNAEPNWVALTEQDKDGKTIAAVVNQSVAPESDGWEKSVLSLACLNDQNAEEGGLISFSFAQAPFEEGDAVAYVAWDDSEDSTGYAVTLATSSGELNAFFFEENYLELLEGLKNSKQISIVLEQEGQEKNKFFKFNLSGAELLNGLGCFSAAE